MNPDTGRFERMTDKEAEAFYEAMVIEAPHRLADAHRRHGIKQAQIFRVGEAVEIKGCAYRVKAIHTKSITFER